MSSDALSAGQARRRRITPSWLLRNFEEVISCAGLALILVVVSVNVMLRYFFASSIAWAEEVSVLGFSCVIFIGSAAVYKRNMHVGIDVFVNLMPRVLRNAVTALTRIFMLVFTAYVTYLGWIYSIEAWDKPTSILFFPYFFINFPICIGFASMAFYSLLNVLRMRKDTRPDAAEGGEGTA